MANEATELARLEPANRVSFVGQGRGQNTLTTGAASSPAFTWGAPRTTRLKRTSTTGA
jgi:hypothetical protein